MNKTSKSVLSLSVAAVAVVGLVVAPTAQAASDTTSTSINVIIASVISITSPATVTLNVTPITGGGQATATDTVTVNTNQATGYTLSVGDADATLNLVNGVNTIAQHTGTFAAPTVLANNSWGYAVGSGTTGSVVSTQFNTPANYTSTPNSSKFAGITAVAQNIKTTTATATGDTTAVYWSAKVDTSKPAGTYSDIITYTATTNP